MTQTSEALLKAFGQLIQKRPFMGAVASSLRFGDRQRQPNQLRLLRLLDQKGEMTNSDLVEALDIRPSSVSALVQKLEELGLISRHESETDKRVQLIGLTDDGRKFIETTGKLRTDLPDQIFSGLSEEEQAELLKLINKLSEDLANRDDLSWPEGKQFDDMRIWAERFHHGHHGPRRGYPGSFSAGGPRGFDRRF
ncbi:MULTISPECIES: MarR family winged helix-turn-helix transcriptional regulator [Lacticaseibacillus]|uniref:Winged helix-turn-helix transcriptional regulator n=3 Tax=Lacticaseibacillus TaxID=2759736 RepID=A0A5R8LTA0_LACZE|nr:MULTISPECIES: MarR family winged helix-turn-helix transcriptional regulator [Lacticaseibacillus]KRK12036.1 MarR family transcriptional regulator [Lacticaseibacillus zeae DSM 20178 = KCTC 3804]MBI6596824.1 winged helix-turn-helix transcriptional regulator [Lacticaseibacillus casei]MBO1480661.1 winged helix-turn-helix transcriptional regulator [Lacticaseibacillus casei]MBO2415940.1 winged helix-turn-helix transcriptional regulator [Lacticaseibacillus casei]MCK2081006.1 winged helix-turn-helix